MCKTHNKRFSKRPDLRKHNITPCCTQKNEEIIEEDVNLIQCTEYVCSDCNQLFINRLESFNMFFNNESKINNFVVKLESKF